MRHLALAMLVIVAAGSNAHASRRHRRHKKPRPALEVELAEQRRHTLGKPMKDWTIAFGPNLWAASVDADVSVGSATVSSGIDFLDITRHTRWGAAALIEGRYRRFSFQTDFLYGVVDINGAKEVGPLMMRLDGTAKSLLLDGLAGVRVAGDEQGLWSVEARGGIRYQRTTVSGTLMVGESPLTAPEHVDSGADGLGGVRVFVRPHRRVALVGAADIGVFGDSSSTWSASIDANLRVMSNVVLSVGWRTLTQDKAPVSLEMHGPRAAVQLLF